jgi:hypothetical protein
MNSDDFPGQEEILNLRFRGRKWLPLLALFIELNPAFGIVIYVHKTREDFNNLPNHYSFGDFHLHRISF